MRKTLKTIFLFFLFEAEQVSMTKIVETWYGENVDYNLNTNVCAPNKVCGHYTQVTVILELSLHELTTATRNTVPITCCSYKQWRPQHLESWNCTLCEKTELCELNLNSIFSSNSQFVQHELNLNA